MRNGGARTGSSRSRMSTNLSWGTYLPITTRTTVIGVESNNPIGPQSHTQKTADTSTASGDIPVDAPYHIGSMNCATIISRTVNIDRVPRKTALTGNSAKASSNGMP